MKDIKNILGKGEAESSNLSSSTIFPNKIRNLRNVTVGLVHDVGLLFRSTLHWSR